MPTQVPSATHQNRPRRSGSAPVGQDIHLRPPTRDGPLQAPLALPPPRPVPLAQLRSRPAPHDDPAVLVLLDNAPPRHRPADADQLGRRCRAGGQPAMGGEVGRAPLVARDEHRDMARPAHALAGRAPHPARLARERPERECQLPAVAGDGRGAGGRGGREAQGAGEPGVNGRLVCGRRAEQLQGGDVRQAEGDV